jgi:hypothetical protein
MSGIDFPIPHGSQLYTILERFAQVRLRRGNSGFQSLPRNRGYA